MKKKCLLFLSHKVFIVLFFALCLVHTPLSILAQNALGCNGIRYATDVFTDTTMTTVRYGVNNVGATTQQLYMDIVQPKNDTLSRRPIIIWAFGGGFVTGQRQDMRAFCQLYSQKGYVTASIDYRLFPFFGVLPDSTAVTNTIIQAVQDMKASIRYIRKTVKENGNPYRIDTSNIIVGGVSAGAITAMLTAEMDSLDPIPTWIRTIIANQGGIEGNTGTPLYSSTVKGAISMSGGLYRKEWLDKDDVPFAAYHGTADNIVAYGYGKNVYNFYGDGDGTLAPRAVELGIPTVLVTVPGGGHTDIYPSSPTNYPPSFVVWLGKMTDFVQRLICGTKPLSAEDIENHDVKVYPNPAYEEMTIEIDKNTEGGKFELSVFDAVGRQVLSLKNQNSKMLVLHKTDIGTGLFLVRMNFGDNTKPVLKKIIFE